jgi:epoxyqueuosine reductase
MMLFEDLEKNGLRGRIISVEHLNEIKEEIESRHRNGLFDETFYQERLKYFKYQKPVSLSGAKSIVVVAVPQPMIKITFHWQGRALPLTLPPTYIDNTKIDRYVKGLLEQSLRPESYKFVRAVLPVKTLAVRSGLALFGRNNIAYMPKFGSFHRLTAFFTDYPCPEDQWQEPQILPKCQECRACLKACPVGAIAEERFLIKAERCLTYLNEKTADHAFPEWVDPSWHNAIVGCMHCQRVCPYNKDVLAWSEDRGESTEEETGYLLRGEFSGERAAKIGRKLRRLGLDLTIFPRNLAPLLK